MRKKTSSILLILFIILSFIPVRPTSCLAGGTWNQEVAPEPGADVQIDDADITFDLSKFRYDRVMLDVGEQVKNARHAFFKPDGTRLYVVGRTSMNVAEFHLATPWDVSSGTFVREFDLSPTVGTRNQYPRPQGIFINKENGKDLVIVNRTELFQFELAEPWNITSAVPTKYIDISMAVSRVQGIHISPDGAWLYLDDRETIYVYQFRMDRPWDIESLRLRAVLDIRPEEQDTRGIEFSPDGSRLYISDQGRRHILEYHLDQPWMIKDASFSQFFVLARQTPNPVSINWKPDGTRFFVTCSYNNRILQYSIR